MAKAIEDYLGVRDVRSAPDLIFDGQTVTANDTVTSAEFNVGKTQLGLEIVIHVDTAIVLAATQVLTIDYLYGDSYAESVSLFSATGTASTGDTFAAGELLRFAPTSDLPTSGKLQIVNDDAALTGAVSAWVEYVAR